MRRKNSTSNLEEKAREVSKDYEKRKAEISRPDYEVILFLYKIQANIIHPGRDLKRRQKMIDVFNSLPLPYRRFAYQNYEGDGLLTDREQYTLRMKQEVT